MATRMHWIWHRDMGPRIERRWIYLRRVCERFRGSVFIDASYEVFLFYVFFSR